MRRALAIASVAAAVAAAVLAPVALLADVASCSVTASSYADSVVNPPSGEDTEFFVSTGGVPNIIFVLDTSGTMRRLPPDGAANSWGSFERPGNTLPGEGYGCSNEYGNTRVFNSPCGTTTLDLKPFNPNPGNPPPDFAQAKDASGRYCPYMISGNQPPATDKPGFDPDFYGGSGGNPWFFEPTKVYHDTIYSPDPTSDGWTDWSTNPTGHASIAGFCAQWSANPAKEASCNACMRDRGYFFDGTYLASTGRSCGSTADCQKRGQGTCISKLTGLEHAGLDDGTAECRIPHVWLSGNFLNFFPPKFVVARKVMKDVLQSVRKIRLGLTVFSRVKDGSSFVSDGGTIVRRLNPACNMLGSPSQFDANRSAFLAAVNSPFHSFGNNKYSFFGDAPIAETLLDVGNLHLTKDLPWFDASYDKAAFEDQTTSSNSKSVCFSCQASAILLISGGVATADGKVPGIDFASQGMTLSQSNAAGSYAGMSGFNVTGISPAECPVCETPAEAPDTSIPPGQCRGQQASGGCDDAGNPVPSYLPKVAWYLKNMDFRLNTETGKDGFPLTGKQSITTYTIGLGARGAAAEILAHTAEAGGGLYNGGSGSDVADAKTLREAILRVLEDVNTRSTSFGAASLSTLQVTTTQGVLVPRFEPSRSAHWDGHLYAFDLYSEFASANNPVPGKVVCAPRDPATSGPANGDYDCDGKCGSVFLMDAEGDFIQEDGTGAFKKSLNRNRAACGGGSLCSASNCSGPDPDAPAVPYWDAGSKLAPVKAVKDPVSGMVLESANPDFVKGGPLEWRNRRIYTVVDSNGDRKFREDDGLVDLRTADPAALVPYLNIRGTRFCNDLATRLAARGNPAGATIAAEAIAGVYTTCADMLLKYVRGADIFDERRGDPDCASYPASYCTRKYQLGDIFHSSPIEVWPPLPSDSFSCSRGLHPQCLPSLFSSSIENPARTAGNANAYDDYAKSSRYRNRRKFALVGANDGMLHAFQIERKRPDGSPNPDVGSEIWAFIPPDLLPKLKLLLGGVHHFYVDGTPMVRDVWIDGGVHNKLSGGGSGTPDGIRQGEEFHTVAIVGERRGGTHYFALDVTDASDDLDARPRFMWLYPQPDDPEQLQFGETYVEFVPKPPPIGPVRLDKGAPPCTGNYKEYTGGGGTRCFEERWIVFLSGGFDPQYTRGRGVHMVSIADGKEIWDFSQPTGAASACGSSSDPRCKLNYPVAATVGMMMWGTQPNFLTAASVDGYFDTATFGDTGGQLWTLRFNDPGIIDSTTGKVKNWFGARAFQLGATSTTPACGLEYCGGQPFFYITSNLPLAANGLYRTLAGTGDRYNLLDPVGGVCGPDNIRACLLKGCTVRLQDGAGGPGAVFGVEPLLGKQWYEMEHLACSSSTADYTFGATAPAGTSCTTVTAKVNDIVITCPSTVTCSGQAEATRKRVSTSCSGDACEATATNEHGIPIDLKGNRDKRNWFFSVQVFEQTGPRTIFRTLEEAIRYDAARLTESDLKNVNAYDSNPIPSNLASPNDRGWSYYFDHGRPTSTQTVRINGLDHDIYRTDERNASVSAVEYGCAFWNTMQPATPVGALDSVTNCPVNSPCKAGKAQISYLYGANPGTGGLCLQVSGENTRSQRSETLVPPHIGKLVAYVGQGQVSFGLTSVRVPQGGSNIQLGEAQDLASPVQWLPVDRSMHACRHAPKAAPPAPEACR